LALQPVRVPEEHADSAAEVGDEAVRRPAGDQALPDGVERLLGRRLQSEVVDAAPPEHGRLALGLGVIHHLEHVELGGRPDVHERQAHALGLRPVVEHGGVEHVPVEGVEPVRVAGEHGHVVDAVQEHAPSVGPCRACSGSAKKAPNARNPREGPISTGAGARSRRIRSMSLWSGLRRRAADVLPKGAPLAEDEWARRHYWILLLLYVHVPALVLFGALNHRSLVHCTMETLPVVICAYVASQRVASRQVRSVLAALGLMLCSAILVHLSGGVTEMHFHFFVMLGVISLYQDWRPFLVAIGFVTLHHGVMGILRPRDVFDHASAWHSPVKWAVIHGGFVLAASAVSVVAWRIIEDDHRRSQEKLAERERRFRALIEHSSDMIALMDATGTLVYSSPSTIKVLGYTPEEAVGRPATDFDHPDDADRARPVLERVLSRPGSSGEMDLRLRHKDGGYRWVHMVITNLLDEPGVNAVVSNARDINEQRALQDQLSHQAFHDPLTGLPNRA